MKQASSNPSPDTAGEVRDNAQLKRFELAVGDQIAIATYVARGEDTIAITHTLVPPALEGRGIGSRLVAGALDTARARGQRVIPQCSFVEAYIRRHPQYADLVAR